MSKRIRHRHQRMPVYYRVIRTGGTVTLYTLRMLWTLQILWRLFFSPDVSNCLILSHPFDARYSNAANLAAQIPRASARGLEFGRLNGMAKPLECGDLSPLWSRAERAPRSGDTP